MPGSTVRGDSALRDPASRGRLGLLVAGACAVFVFALLNWPDAHSLADLAEPLLFVDTTPSGGDMGAHVWGPAYLRDHLLPQARLSGWAPDWYSGFPAYHFYMVIPSLAIVALNVGIPWPIGISLLAAAAGGLYVVERRSSGRPTANSRVERLRELATAPENRVPVIVALAVIAVLVVALPYGIAFKLISVSGLVAFPFAAWLMGRLAGSPEPIPAFLALGAFIFLFDTNFTIYGGNITSTLAGEFAFSISLTLTLVAVGLALQGMDRGRWRARTTVVVALVALCHIIPVFFLIPALMLATLSDGVTTARTWMLAGSISLVLLPIAFADGRSLGIVVLAASALIVVFVAAAAGDSTLFARYRWLLVVGPVAMAVSAFWLLPFYLREPYFNDMGWERLDEVGAPMLTVPMKLALPVAAIGVLLAYAARERIGMIFGGLGLVFAAAVANLGEGPLWNARLLPFYYLAVYLTAAVGVAMVVRYVGTLISGDLARPSVLTMTLSSLAALVAVFVAVAMPLRLMPFGDINEEGEYEWLVFTNYARSAVPSWASWNYSGYERKESYREYHGVVTTMASVGETNGCGRAMWEYSKELDRYGTPMALMLLPHWTDGCIGSMEGLYFESSATTPFHFLNQSVLSDAPSRAQRDLPYQGFDIDTGVEQLQLMGVRYYMAQSDNAIAAAESHPSLTQVGEAQPFVIFEVDGSELVEGLQYEPVVVSGRSAEQLANDEAVTRFDVGWVGQAVNQYNDPAAYLALPAEDGPPGWERRESLATSDGDPVDPVAVSNVATTDSTISFDVDRVGEPVLVKASYFPNWTADGADGPWRVGPNLMVVVPTDTSVRLAYDRTLIDWFSTILTVAGLAIVGMLAVRARRQPRPSLRPERVMMAPRAAEGDQTADEQVAVFSPPESATPVGAASAAPKTIGTTTASRVVPTDQSGNGRQETVSDRADPPVEQPEPPDQSAVSRQ